MRRKHRIHTLSAIALTLLLAAQLSAQTLYFAEEFFSREYCDTMITTAVWDTVAGEIRLWSLDAETAGTYAMSGANRTAIVGDIAYVANADGALPGLYAISIRDPENPVFLGSTADFIFNDVVVAGNYAFCACNSGLAVVDIDDPSNPVVVETVFGYGDYFCSITVRGDYAYVGSCVYSTVNVFNISNPLAVSYSISESNVLSYSITSSGSIGYFASGSNGLKVIDLRRMPVGGPTPLGDCDTPGSAQDVFIAGDYAYVADGDSGLQVIDVSNPSSPSIAGSYATPGFASGVCVSGNYALVADEGSGIHAFDITDPTDPVLLGTNGVSGTAKKVVIEGELALVSDSEDGIHILKICEVITPAIKGGCDTPGNARDMCVHGDYLFLADQDSGIQIMDISDPENPAPAGNYDTPGTAGQIVIEGDFAYVADGTDGGLLVLDVSDPENPAFVSSVDTTCGSVAIHGDYAFITDGDNGMLHTVDIFDPASPAVVGSYTNLTRPYYVTVEGNYAYVIDPYHEMGMFDLADLNILDISDPENPTYVGHFGYSSFSRHVVVRGDYAFAPFTTSGMFVIDVSNPSNPTLEAQFGEPNRALRVAVDGNYAFLIDGDNGVYLVNIENPTSPYREAVQPTPGFSNAVAVSGDYAFVGDGESGLQVFRIRKRGIDAENNLAQSLVFDQPGANINRVRIATVQTDSIRWEVSADNGANWQEVLPDYEWQPLDNPGSDMMWRADLVLRSITSPPSCRLLILEYEYCTATLLQSCQAIGGENAIRIEWRLSELDEGTVFTVWRAKASEDKYTELDGSLIQSEGLSFSFEDTGIARGIDYRYRVEYKSASGGGLLFETEAVSLPKLPLTLYQNIPNPFNPATSIRFYLPEPMRVRIDIYDVNGREIIRLEDNIREEGFAEIEWDGKNSTGEPVSSGVYYYCMRAGKKRLAKKMVLLR